MIRTAHVLGIAVVAATLALCAPNAGAGRQGGPYSTTVTVPAYQSVAIQVPFNGGEQAVVSIVGNGKTILQLNIYDGDGHVSTGTGRWDRKIATMNVYRVGTFRVEVVNMGQSDNTIVLTTN